MPRFPHSKVKRDNGMSLLVYETLYCPTIGRKQHLGKGAAAFDPASGASTGDPAGSSRTASGRRHGSGRAPRNHYADSADFAVMGEAATGTFGCPRAPACTSILCDSLRRIHNHHRIVATTGGHQLGRRLVHLLGVIGLLIVRHGGRCSGLHRL